MKKETAFLKFCLLGIGLFVIFLCVVTFILFHREAMASSVRMSMILYGILALMYLSAIPFYIGLYNAFKLLCYIDENQAFSDYSITALKNIKKCAFAVSIIYLVGMPLFYIVAEVDDAPGIILVAMFFAFAPFVVSVFANVLQKLFENALEIKKDNDLVI